MSEPIPDFEAIARSHLAERLELEIGVAQLQIPLARGILDRLAFTGETVPGQAAPKVAGYTFGKELWHRAGTIANLLVSRTLGLTMEEVEAQPIDIQPGLTKDGRATVVGSRHFPMTDTLLLAEGRYDAVDNTIGGYLLYWVMNTPAHDVKQEP